MSEICVQPAEHQCSNEFVFKLQVIAPVMKPKKCPDFVLDLQKVSAPAKQPKKCPKFVLDLLKLSGPMMEPQNFVF